MDDIKTEKKRIRNEIRQTFKSLPRKDFDSMSRNVLLNLERLEIWNNAETVLVFLSLPDEIKTDIIIEKAFSEGKKIAVPKINGNDMLFFFIDDLNGNFKKHPLGMYEPVSDPAKGSPVSISSLEPGKSLVLVPGLAFDRHLRRLGRGKGFYDRFLSSLNSNITKAGIGYDFQIIKSVPSEEHDIKLDILVTDESVIS